MSNRVKSLNYENDMLNEEMQSLNQMVDTEVVNLDLFKTKSLLAQETLNHLRNIDDNNQLLKY